MKKDKILIGLLVVLFLVGATSLALGATITRELESHQYLMEPGSPLGQFTGPNGIATIRDEGTMTEIWIAAKGLDAKCLHSVWLKKPDGSLNEVGGEFGNSFVTSKLGAGSYIFRVDSKELNEAKVIDIFATPGCASANNMYARILSLNLEAVR